MDPQIRLRRSSGKVQESAGKWVESRDSQVDLQGSCKSSQAVKQVTERCKSKCGFGSE